ncbi:EF-P lysine aminoacylase EpmA [Sorangium cellulosum]|uniref:EF-P lysine aminoacylase EpmA n=1 Tax=Sorangium cellulosum TaxID=56 RepID=UPI000CF42D32|nr:EF-P lysine aminoacylase EpmA [Sorangium cellulosum]
MTHIETSSSTRFPETFAPSDITSAGAPLPGRVRVGGRVLEVAEGAVVLGDALGALRVAFDGGAPALEVGDLAVVVGTPAGGALADARLAEHIAPRRPPRGRSGAASPPSSETERAIHRGRGAALARRAAALAAIRALFAERGFLEVETPSMVPSPGLDLHLDAFVVEAARPTFLITSPEYQMKRLLSGGVARCFQLARCFRRGELGDRHNPEFTMLEWYRAFASVDEVMSDTEVIVQRVADALGAGDTLAPSASGARVSLRPPFPRIAVGDAFARWAGVPADDAIALASRDEERFFRLLVDVVEPAIAALPHPVFLVDFPAPFASLARLKPGDPRVCERFELYVAGVELCNGFGELTDPVEQRARLAADQAARAARGKPVYPIDERFLDALEEGMPPAAGNALGVDRLVALCLGAKAIGDVLAFPHGWL